MTGFDPPRASPLATLEEVLDWHPGYLPHDDLRRCHLPLPKLHRCSGTPRPRLLACHDMAGGYGEDALLQGGRDAMSYCHADWRALDVVVYFSHRLATLPPPGWAAAAHLHGVPVLGTLITEWGQGKEVCERAFASEACAESLAGQLAAMARHYGFDGWLINIENPLPLELLPNVQHFLRDLTAMMQQQHGNSSNIPCVLWYDSVTTKGELKWQDTLNDLNRPFFDACSGIFTNYVWKAGTPAQAALVAGPRAHDVFMGIDVFGRNTFGGGGFACNRAIEVARPAGVSVALFAPGWVFEQAEGGHMDYLARQQHFWDLVLDAWCGGDGGDSGCAGVDECGGCGSGHGGDGGGGGGGGGGDGDGDDGDGGDGDGGDDCGGEGDGDGVGHGSHKSAAALSCGGGLSAGMLLSTHGSWPLYSCFSQGCSPDGLYCQGWLISSSPWFNLALQSLQPQLQPLPFAAPTAGRVRDNGSGTTGAAIGGTDSNGDVAAGSGDVAAGGGDVAAGGDPSSSGGDVGGLEGGVRGMRIGQGDEVSGMRACVRAGVAFNDGACVELAGHLPACRTSSFVLFATRLEISSSKHSSNSSNSSSGSNGAMGLLLVRYATKQVQPGSGLCIGLLLLRPGGEAVGGEAVGGASVQPGRPGAVEGTRASASKPHAQSGVKPVASWVWLQPPALPFEQQSAGAAEQRSGTHLQHPSCSVDAHRSTPLAGGWVSHEIEVGLSPHGWQQQQGNANGDSSSAATTLLGGVAVRCLWEEEATSDGYGISAGGQAGSGGGGGGKEGEGGKAGSGGGESAAADGQYGALLGEVLVCPRALLPTLRPLRAVRLQAADVRWHPLAAAAVGDGGDASKFDGDDASSFDGDDASRGGDGGDVSKGGDSSNSRQGAGGNALMLGEGSAKHGHTGGRDADEAMLGFSGVLSWESPPQGSSGSGGARWDVWALAEDGSNEAGGKHGDAAAGWRWLGSCHTGRFVVASLPVPLGCSAVGLAVQGVGPDGRRGDLATCALCTVVKEVA